MTKPEDDALADAMREDIPGTEPSKRKKNPDVGRAATATAVREGAARAGPKTVAKHNTPGSALVPDLDTLSAGVTREYVYWVGVTPSCPVEHIDCAGINFPKLNEKIMPRAGQKGKYQRVPVIGALVTLTAAKAAVMRDKLPRTVLRFLNEKTAQQEADAINSAEAGVNLGDLIQRPRKGYLITIPTADEAKARHTPPYVARKNDEPAARYMFAVLCENQDKPQRGEFYPDVLEDTGLDWPEDVQE